VAEPEKLPLGGSFLPIEQTNNRRNENFVLVYLFFNLSSKRTEKRINRRVGADRGFRNEFKFEGCRQIPDAEKSPENKSRPLITVEKN